MVLEYWEFVDNWLRYEWLLLDFLRSEIPWVRPNHYKTPRQASALEGPPKGKEDPIHER